jgi:hypothetical protein
VRANLVVVPLIRIEQMAKMPFAEDNHMIEAVPPDRTDQPLRCRISKLFDHFTDWLILVRHFS